MEIQLLCNICLFLTTLILLALKEDLDVYEFEQRIPQMLIFSFSYRIGWLCNSRRRVVVPFSMINILICIYKCTHVLIHVLKIIYLSKTLQCHSILIHLFSNQSIYCSIKHKLIKVYHYLYNFTVQVLQNTKDKMSNSNTTTFKMKKVYNLRKTISALKPKEKLQESKIDRDLEENNSNADHLLSQKNNSQVIENHSIFKKNQLAVNSNENTEPEPSTRRLVDGPQLTVDTLFLEFEQKLGCIQTKQVKVKNIGSSAIYYQWVFKNQPKINPHAIKDLKPKFFCHYEKNSIKPGQEIIFVFSFTSEIPGFFMEECNLICEPAIKTPVPAIRLQGKAYIDDQWKEDRAIFLKQLQDSTRLCTVGQLVDDIVCEVRLPEPQRPDVKDEKIAEQLFQKNNQNQNLSYNPYVHTWFNELFNEVWKKSNPQVNQEQAYWDQSIESLKSLIQEGENLDQVDKICFMERLQHYTHLCTFPLPNKSQIYETVFNLISDSVYSLGGDHADAVKKELDMWQVPFRYPTQQDTEEQLKARKEQIQKIKTEWIKRTKKKKWGEQEEKQMIQDFKAKLQAKVSSDILNGFSGFQNRAEYIKAENEIANSSFQAQKYFEFLERCKTIKQYPIEGKKVMIKLNLKLKQNSQKQLQQLEEYLIKKEEQKQKLQDEKKNQDSKKKKPVKKKGQKQQEEQKPLTFDFSTLLDQQNWNGFLQTFRTVQEKSPFMILIGFTYRDRIGRTQKKLSVKFMLQILKGIQPSIQFMQHEQLFNIKEQIQNENISQGSIYLVQNLNFLPSQTLIAQEIQKYTVVQDQKQVQKEKIVKRNVIYPQVRKNLDRWVKELDLIIDEDRFLNKSSGISSHSHLEVVLGTQWWRYIGLVNRVKGQSVVLSGDFNPESFILLNRLIAYAKQIYLGGKIAVKFSIVANRLQDLKFGNISIQQNESKMIRKLLDNDIHNKLWIPNQFKLIKVINEQKQPEEEGGQKTIVERKQLKIVKIKPVKIAKQLENKNIQENADQDKLQQQPEQEQVKEDYENCVVVDISTQLSEQFNKIKSGHFFMLGRTIVSDYDCKQFGAQSTVQILKNIYKVQEQKRTRHIAEVNTPQGINYAEDFVLYLVGIDEGFVEKIEFKEKKVKLSENAEQEDQVDEPEEEPEQEEGEEKKKIDLVADYQLNSESTVRKLMAAEFDYGLKNISRYPKPRVI